MTRQRERETQKWREKVLLLGAMVAKGIQEVRDDPELGPVIADRLDRHYRETVRPRMLEIVPEAWDLLRPECWPTRKPDA